MDDDSPDEAVPVPAKAEALYQAIISDIFRRLYPPGATEFEFERDEIERSVDLLKVKRPKNLGDVIYTFRYRRKLPAEILATQPEGKHWLILGAGDAKYRFRLTDLAYIYPQKGLLGTIAKGPRAGTLPTGRTLMLTMKIPALRFDEWRGTMDGRPTMWVRWLVRRGDLRVDIHKIVAADDPECWHTHPAMALRFVYRGGYIEEMSDGSKRTWRPGMIGLVRPELCHRIDGLRGGASYSLWWQWGRRQMVELHGAGWKKQEQLYRARNTVMLEALEARGLPMSDLEIRCNGCGKPPERIADIAEAAAANRMSPTDYVQVLEPTFNKANGHFMCTDCYMEAGIRDPAWRAP